MKEGDMDESGLKLGFNEAQLLLAEKRTTLAMFRTAVSMIGLPMAVVSFLIAVSKQLHVKDVIGYLTPLLTVCAVLATVGVYLMVRSIRRLRFQQKLISRLKDENPILKRWIY